MIGLSTTTDEAEPDSTNTAPELDERSVDTSVDRSTDKGEVSYGLEDLAHDAGLNYYDLYNKIQAEFYPGNWKIAILPDTTTSRCVAQLRINHEATEKTRSNIVIEAMRPHEFDTAEDGHDLRFNVIKHTEGETTNDLTTRSLWTALSRASTLARHQARSRYTQRLGNRIGNAIYRLRHSTAQQ